MLIWTVKVDHPFPEIAVITRSRPEDLNTLNSDLVAELKRGPFPIEQHKHCRAVILTGRGRAFCAWLDLQGFGDPQREEEEGPVLGALPRQRELASVSDQLRRLPQPVIAPANGPAAGGSVAIACAADIRLAINEAVFGASFIKAGYSACDLGISWLLPRIVGVGRAHELMLTARRVDADEAFRIRLVTEILPAGAPIDAAVGVAQSILSSPPVSVELTKQGMWMGVSTPTLHQTAEFENRRQVITAMTTDQQEATAALLGKRSPKYHRR